MRNWQPLVLITAVSLAACHKQKPPPSIDGLTAALERSAEQTLTAPALANEQVIIPLKPGKVDAQAAEVVQAASDAGGVAIRSVNARGQVSILATIPENNADAVKAALRKEKPPMNKPAATTRLIEVLIENTAPSPTP
jgi:hypothetical protein